MKGYIGRSVKWDGIVKNLSIALYLLVTTRFYFTVMPSICVL